MITDILNTLGTTVNFHKIMKLAEKYNEININNYLNLCPAININFEYSDKIDSNFYNRNIFSLKSFRLSDEYLQTDIAVFLRNIEDVVEMTFYNNTFRVTSGKYYLGDEGFRSIEYELHNIKAEAIDTKKYSLYGILISEKEHKTLIRKAKYNKFNGNSKSLKELVEELRDKKRDILLAERKKKQEEAKKKEMYSFYDNDDFSKLIITAC